MAQYVVGDNSPRARAARVQATGQIRGSTPLSQQIIDADNFVRRQIGAPPIPVPGLAPTAEEQQLGGASPVPGQPEVLPMWASDP